MKKFLFIAFCLFLFSACSIPFMQIDFDSPSSLTQPKIPLVYNVESIVFIDYNDELLSTQTDFDWDSFWNGQKDLILKELNATFGENSFIQEGEGSFGIQGGVQEISSEDFHGLRKALDSALDYETDSAYYDFTVVYDASSNTILITLTTHVKERTFNALQFSEDAEQSYISVTANLTRVSEYLAIYSGTSATMSEDDIDYLVSNFDSMYTKLIDIYGTHTDVDNNNKVILLLYNMNINPSGSYVAGYFYPGDLYSQYSEGNRAEILYVESNVSDNMYNIFTTLIHEFQHLINTSITLSTRKQSDLWLNEALSESTEIIYAKAMSANRLNVYNGYSHEYITNGNNFYYWPNSGEDVLSNYSTASLFMYWLYLYGGEQIIEDIARSQYGNYRAVEEAVKISTSSYLRSFASWEEIVFAWYEANENYSVGYKNAIVSQNVGNSFTLTSKINKNYGGSALLNVGSVILTESEVDTRDSNILKDSFTKGGKTVHLTMNNQKSVTERATISVSIPASQAPSARSALQDFVPVYDDGGYNIIHIPQSYFDIEALEQ